MYPETILPIAAHIPHAGTEVPQVPFGSGLTFYRDRWYKRGQDCVKYEE